MNRRSFLTRALTLTLATAGVITVPTLVRAGSAKSPSPEVVKMALQQANQPAPKIDKLELSDAEWKKRLSAPAYDVLRKEGTERPFTSPFNDEKRKGVFHCSGCDHPVFTSEMKFDSGTGWPSFYTTLPGAFEKSRDFKMILPRTEYHCAKCGGHHGHVFTDGPEPTKQRWCNNGVSLVFRAA